MSNSPADNAPAKQRRGSTFWHSSWVLSLGRFVALFAVFVFFAMAVEGGKFYSPRNLENIARQSAVYAVAALGMTMVIIAGGIDLSAGSIIALAAVVSAWVLNLQTAPAAGEGPPVHLVEQWPQLVPILAVAAAVVAGSLAGLVNGLLIVGLRLVPFIVTLGTMLIFRGLAKGIARDRDIYPPDDSWIFSVLDPTITSPEASRRWMVLPPGVWMVVIAAIVAALLLRYTRLGRHIFAIGSNEQTARLCGVPVERTKLVVYTLAGFFSGLAAILLFSDIRIGQPTAAVAYELSIIAAVVIGGGSLMGGEGSILGSILGALMITILYMGGKQMGWEQWVQDAAIGAIIIAAVTLDRVRHRGAQ